MNLKHNALFFFLLSLAAVIVAILTSASMNDLTTKLSASVGAILILWFYITGTEMVWDEMQEKRRNGRSWAEILGMDKESLRKLSES